jgi:hypothetical protein
MRWAAVTSVSDVPDEDGLHREAEKLQTLATVMLNSRRHEPSKDDLVGIMQNVAAATDGAVTDEDRRTLRTRLISLREAMERAHHIEDEHGQVARANIAVALASSRRLRDDYLHPERKRSMARFRQPLIAGVVATGVFVVGGLGFLAGDASDDGEALSLAPDTSSAQTSVAEVERFMAILDGVQEDWQPILEELTQTRGPITDECDEHVTDLETWTSQLNAVGMQDPALQQAGTDYLSAMRIVAVDCDDDGPALLRAYQDQESLLEAAKARATELGWSQTG